MCFLGGCGNSDKFSGTWIGVGDHTTLGGTKMAYMELTAEKNGDNTYIVNFDEPEPYWVENEKKVYLLWPNPKGGYVGTVQDNVMDVQYSESPRPNTTLTYIEKDGSLQIKVGRDTIYLQKVNENEKNKIMDLIKTKFEEALKTDKNKPDGGQNYDTVITDQNETMEQLMKEHPTERIKASPVVNHKEYNPWEKY